MMALLQWNICNKKDKDELLLDLQLNYLINQINTGHTDFTVRVKRYPRVISILNI